MCLRYKKNIYLRKVTAASQDHLMTSSTSRFCGTMNFTVLWAKKVNPLQVKSKILFSVKSTCWKQSWLCILRFFDLLEAATNALYLGPILNLSQKLLSSSHCLQGKLVQSSRFQKQKGKITDKNQDEIVSCTRLLSRPGKKELSCWILWPICASYHSCLSQEPWISGKKNGTTGF